MRLFLLVFFFIYGALHLHAFLRAKAAFDFGARTGIILVFFFIVMVLAPVIIRQSENAGFDLFARYMAWIGYTWLGFIFLFFSASAFPGWNIPEAKAPPVRYSREAKEPL